MCGGLTVTEVGTGMCGGLTVTGGYWNVWWVDSDRSRYRNVWWVDSDRRVLEYAGRLTVTEEGTGMCRWVDSEKSRNVWVG